MILLIVWDGLRPDLICDELTPYLARQSRAGVLCRQSHAAWPSATRINAATLSTGCQPGKHGLVDNELYVPAVDPAQPISCADWRALQAMADAEGGRLLSVPTLPELLARHGRRFVSGGSGSPGTTYLTNPTVTAPIVNWAVAWPESFEAELRDEHGGLLTEAASSAERNRQVIATLRDLLIPRYRPDVVTLWITEPDHAQHAHGIGSPEAVDALRQVDAEVEALVAHLADALPEPLTVFCLSDHGFDTIGPDHPATAALIAAGFKASADSLDVVRTGCSLYLSSEVLRRVGELAAWLLAQPWVSGVFVRDDVLATCPGALPQSAVGGGHARSAPIMYSPRWNDGVNAYGVPGMVAGRPGSSVATHGSTSPYSLRNTLVAWGAGLRQGITSDAPCGLVDVAPTVLRLLGIARPASMDGRVLHELLLDGPAPADVPVHTVTRQADAAGWRQVAHYSITDGHAYLDRTVVEPAG
ncbi:MAG: alkaline phosphatase family protein [Anaerolineae bacterium]